MSANNSIIDLAPALARLDQDRGLLCDLARFFLEDSLQLLGELEQGLDNGDAELVTRCAHSLKSLASNFDAHRTVAVAREAEQQGLRGDLSSVVVGLPQLQYEVQLVRQALQDQLLAQEAGSEG